ncbi:hypothetical protein F2982_29345 (plasmid) [Rhizobium sp. BG4]|nr:hypothetical protein F2982_29345 [Rhizobium sp. BG4]
MAPAPLLAAPRVAVPLALARIAARAPVAPATTGPSTPAPMAPTGTRSTPMPPIPRQIQAHRRIRGRITVRPTATIALTRQQRQTTIRRR